MQAHVPGGGSFSKRNRGMSCGGRRCGGEFRPLSSRNHAKQNSERWFLPTLLVPGLQVKLEPPPYTLNHRNYNPLPPQTTTRSTRTYPTPLEQRLHFNHRPTHPHPHLFRTPLLPMPCSPTSRKDAKAQMERMSKVVCSRFGRAHCPPETRHKSKLTHWAPDKTRQDKKASCCTAPRQSTPHENRARQCLGFRWVQGGREGSEGAGIQSQREMMWS